MSHYPVSFQTYAFFKGQKTSSSEAWVVHTCNPSSWEAEAGRQLQVQDQPELHRETLSQKINKT